MRNRTPRRQGTLRHLSVLVATAVGILGMSFLSTAVLNHSWEWAPPGFLLTLLGLWWAGDALQRSIAYHRIQPRAQTRDDAAN